MDPFAVYHIENAQQFWSELDDVLDCSSVSEHGNGSASGSGNGGAGGSGNGTAISGEKLANVLQAFITLTDSYFGESCWRLDLAWVGLPRQRDGMLCNAIARLGLVRAMLGVSGRKQRLTVPALPSLPVPSQTSISTRPTTRITA